MTAPVRIDAAAWGDLRFATLARLCGFADAEHALIKCAKIWSWQTEHYTPERPTYVVEIDLVESALGTGGAAALVRARLAEEGPDGLRIRGSEGRIEWLWKSRNASAAGGEATKRKHANKTRPDGLPSARPEPGPDPRLTPGVLSLSPVLDQIQDPTPPTRAIPQYQPNSWQNRQRWWACMRDAHRRLRDRGIEPNAADLPSSCAGENEKNMLACERSLRDAGDDVETIDRKMRHVVLVVEAECIRDTTLKYIRPALLWDPASFNRSVDKSVDEASKPKRAPARVAPSYGGSKPRTEHPEQPVMRSANEVLG